MTELRIAKVTVNMGIGEGGERLAKAEVLLEQLTGQRPIKTYAKATNQSFGIREGFPIACKVTLRGAKAEEFLKKALEAREHRIPKRSIDKCGNLSFGIKEHIDIPGVRYDPAVGILGMDVCLTMERPGYRVKRRRISTRKISKKHVVTPEESINFLKERYGVKVEG
jgi:large subunit ribosomal protein L5